jgi:ferric-dicitrate binding protein FerR (iron transport regulator)
MDIPINTVEELLCDETFLAWYFKSDVVAVEKWNNRIALDPTQQKLTQEAVQLLQTITVKEQAVDAQRLQLAEAKLRQYLLVQPAQEAKRVSLWSLGNKRWWAAAAAVLILVSTIVWQYNRGTAMLAYNTAYGEMRKELLPDGSEVILNANTTLNYKNRKEGTDREVWVKGEAFFHVKRTAQKNRFIVHTGHFDVIVTGTQFNVINRVGKNNVLLKEGSVTVSGQQQQIDMQPGDYVEFNNTGIQKKAINSAPVLAWTDHKFIFENTPMKEVAALLTELYGAKVTLVNEATASKAISGVMPNDNLDEFLQTLEALPDFEITKSEKEITIRKK